MEYVVLGMSEKTLSVALREKFFVPAQRYPEVLTEVSKLAGVRECFVLSTCNRTEIQVVADTPFDLIPQLQQILCTRAKKPLQELEHNWYHYRNQAAIHHLFRLTSSLDSMLLGETQIFGQVKEAYQVASELKATGNVLNQLFHRAFFVAKRVRHETAIGAGSMSLSTLAVDIIAQSVCFRTPPTILIVGAGDVGTRAAKILHERNLGKLIIINRTFERAKALATELNAEAVPFEELEATLATVAGAIVCSSSPQPTITKYMVEKALARSERSAIALVDVSVPRGVASDVTSVEGIILSTMDDLQSIAHRHREARAHESRRAEEIVTEETSRAVDTILMSKLEPTIAHLMRKCEAIRQREIAKTFDRLPDLSEKNRQMVEACTASIVSKILHDPITSLKEGIERNGHGSHMLDVVRQVFRL